MQMKHIILSLFVLFSLPFFAQKAEDAQTFFNNQQYKEAQDIYGKLLKKNSRDPLTNYRYARCCFELKEYDKAITHFLKTKKGYLQRDYYLGDSYYELYHFDQAAEHYQTYLTKLKDGDPEREKIERKISQSENAERMLMRIEDISITDSITVDKDKFLKFYRYSEELGRLKQEKINIDSLRQEDKITYQTQRRDRLYYSDLDNNHMDIYTSYKLLDTWSEPTRLPLTINSNSNENYPFLLLDGVTLYFASDGENSIGGYDIFITRYVPANDMFLTPENVGMPFNSPHNDYMMVIDEAANQGWFATDRAQIKDKVTIYSFIVNDFKKIIKSENKDSLRSVAQLKTLRKVEVENEDKDITNNQKPEKKEKEDGFNFIIQDNLIYNSISQFKSKEALNAYHELETLFSKKLHIEELLSSLRKQYDSAQDDSQRNEIAPRILLLEKDLRNQEALIEEKVLQIRSEEVKYLQSKK